jgi:hypothetical protein
MISASMAANPLAQGAKGKDAMMAIDRRGFAQGVLACGALAAGPGFARGAGLSLYGNIGARLIHWRVDPAHGAITPAHELTLPAPLQYGWAHPHRPILYAATSDWPGGTAKGTMHHLVAVTVGAMARWPCMARPRR